MKAFNGTFEHNLDAKNRLFVPAEFKQNFEGRLTVRLKLSKYPRIECILENDFDAVVEKEMKAAEKSGRSAELQNSISRAYSKTIPLDGGGRICMPSMLLKKAGITKEAIFFGKGNYFEVWNPEAYDEYLMSLAEIAMEQEQAENEERIKFNQFRSAGCFIEIKNTLGIKDGISTQERNA